MQERDRKLYKEKNSILLMEAFQNDQQLENLKPQFLDNINQGSLLFIHPTVDSIKKCLKKTKETAKVKLRALLFLKECMDTKAKALGEYVQIKILKRLKDLAKISKKPNEKAKLFTKESDNQSIENFFQLLLECLNEWQVMFPIEPNTTRDPSQFKKVASELLEFGIRFPQKRIYFSAKQRASESAPPLSKQTSQQQQSTISKETPKQPKAVEQVKPVDKMKQVPQQNSNEVLLQARELRDGSINYFNIVLECLADDENCQVIIEMAPDLQSLITPINATFLDTLMQLPEDQIQERMLEEIMQIQQIAVDLIKDLAKVQKKNSIFPQLQKKYTSILTKFIKSTEQGQQKSAPNQIQQKNITTSQEVPQKTIVQQQPAQQNPLGNPSQQQFGNEGQSQKRNSQSELNQPQSNQPIQVNWQQSQERQDSNRQKQKSVQFDQNNQFLQPFTQINNLPIPPLQHIEQQQDFSNFNQKSANPFQQEDKQFNQFGDTGNPFQQEDMQFGYSGDNFNNFEDFTKMNLPQRQMNQNNEDVGYLEPWANNANGYQQAMNKSIEQQRTGRGSIMPLQKTQSFPSQQNYDQDFVLQMANSKDQQSPMTPMTSQLKSQGQPFSNIFEMEVSQKQAQDRQENINRSQMRADSASDVGNLSQIRQDRNIQFGFDDFQEDFNLQNMGGGSSVASQRQISEKNQVTVGSNDVRSEVNEPHRYKKSSSFHELGDQQVQQIKSEIYTQNNKYPAEQDQTNYSRDIVKIKSHDQFNTQIQETHFHSQEVSQPTIASQISQPSQPKKTNEVTLQDYTVSVSPQQDFRQTPPSILQYNNTQKRTQLSVNNVGIQVDVNLIDQKKVLNEFQIICKQDPVQEIRHQEEKIQLIQQMDQLKTYNYELKDENSSLLNKLKDFQQKDTFLKSKHQQITNNYEEILTQFSDASEQLNMSRINVLAQHHQLQDVELQNKDFRIQLTEYIQKNRELLETSQEYQNKYNGLLRALSYVCKVKCSQECSSSKYLIQMLAHANKKFETNSKTPDVSKIIEKNQIDIPTKQSLYTKMDYSLFMRVYEASQESNQLENIKYASLMQRGIILENYMVQVGVITKYTYHEEAQNNELSLQINLYNKTLAQINIVDYSIDCPSNNLKNDDLKIQPQLNSKQAAKQILRFTYCDSVKMPILILNINQEKFKIILPVLMTKFCVFQQCDQNYFMQTWASMKQGQSKILRSQIDKPNPKIVRDIGDLRRYWNETVQIRSNSSKMNWIGFGLVGKINNLHQIAIKFLKVRGILKFKIHAPWQIENKAEYLLQTLLFLFTQ